MVKLIGGKLWYCCPRCGKKLHPVSADAICHGIRTQCRQCGWEGPMEITNDKGA